MGNGRIPAKDSEFDLFFGRYRRVVTLNAAGEKTPREFRNGYVLHSRRENSKGGKEGEEPFGPLFSAIIP